MKNLSIVEGVFTVGISLIVLAAVGSTTISPSLFNGNDVLGESIGGGGPQSAFRFTPSPSSTYADGVSKINISAFSFFYKCNSGNYALTLSECDNETNMGYSGVEVTWPLEYTKLSGDVGLTLSASTITTDSSGLANFYVTSTSMGTFKIYAKTSGGYVVGEKSLTFTDPNPPAPVQVTTNKETSTPTKTTVKQEVKKPEIPTVKLVDSAGVELPAPKEGEKVEFKSNEPIVISGTTVPNGTVKLYIFSEPQEATVVADDEGGWSYTVENIEEGEHRVEVEVTDPATGEISDRAEVLAFSVTPSEPTIAVEPTAEAKGGGAAEESSDGIRIVIFVTILTLGIGGAGYWWWKKKSALKLSNAIQETVQQQSQNNITDKDGSDNQSSST